MLPVREPAEIHQQHKAQIAEAKKRVEIVTDLIHEIGNNLTVRSLLLEEVRRQRSFRAAWIRKKTAST
jgi:hypothetical protein